MSGTALADWALTPDPLRITIDVADSLNCPTTGDDLAACLREKPLSELMAVRPSSGAPPSSPFQTAGLTGAAANDQLFAPPVFAPHIDGAVVPNEPLLLMETYNDIFKRYSCGEEYADPPFISLISRAINFYLPLFATPSSIVFSLHFANFPCQRVLPKAVCRLLYMALVLPSSLLLPRALSPLHYTTP